MMTIRRAREQDFADILKIQAEAFGEYQGLYDVNAWTKETLANINLDARDKLILVAEWEGMLVGSVRFWVVAGVCVIRLLSVKPGYQGRGIGEALMREIERLAPDPHAGYPFVPAFDHLPGTEPKTKGPVAVPAGIKLLSV